MTKTLLLFIQSDNPGLYVNVINHCVLNEEVKDIYFALNAAVIGIGRFSEEKHKITKIKHNFQQLSQKHPNIYGQAYKIIDCINPIENKIIEVSFTNPERSIKYLKKKFSDLDQLIIDISGCNKKIAMDIVASYISSNINHICCFELDDKVYLPEWKEQDLTKNYHDIHREISYYQYFDFSSEGTTLESFNRMRFQGKLVRILFLISIILGVMLFILVKQQQNILAQYAVIVLALIQGLGLFNDIFDIRERLK